MSQMFGCGAPDCAATTGGCGRLGCPLLKKADPLVWQPIPREYVPVQVPMPRIGQVTVVIMDHNGNTWVKVDQDKDVPENRDTEH
jgi:hypothetical protein